MAIDLLLRGATKTISTDFDRFKDKLLAVAHFSTLVISVVHVPALAAGMIRYESSAYLWMEFPGTTGCKSDAVITYETGPMTEPCIMLARIERN